MRNQPDVDFLSKTYGRSLRSGHFRSPSPTTQKTNRRQHPQNGQRPTCWFGNLGTSSGTVSGRHRATGIIKVSPQRPSAADHTAIVDDGTASRVEAAIDQQRPIACFDQRVAVKMESVHQFQRGATRNIDRRIVTQVDFHLKLVRPLRFRRPFMLGERFHLASQTSVF